MSLHCIYASPRKCVKGKESTFFEKNPLTEAQSPKRDSNLRHKHKGIGPTHLLSDCGLAGRFACCFGSCCRLAGVLWAPSAWVMKSIFTLFAAATLTDAVHQVNQWQEHSNDDAAHDHRQANNHDRLQQGGHGRNGIVDLVIVIVGNF